VRGDDDDDAVWTTREVQVDGATIGVNPCTTATRAPMTHMATTTNFTDDMNMIVSLDSRKRKNIG
jgi:hypothetical protein